MGSKYFSNRLDDQKIKENVKLKVLKRIQTVRFNLKLLEKLICLVLEK